MKNYYEILGVSKDCNHDEIRKKYRKLAMQYHPDQNPDAPDAEEKFKEIAEAYGVLTDPKKRKEYDACLKWGGGYKPNGQQQQGFGYSQEDILNDLFKDERFQQMFHGLLREFQKSGFRAGPHFVKQSFFGGKGGMVVGGLFLFGSLASSTLIHTVKKKLPANKSIMRSLGRAVGNLLSSNSEKPVKKEVPIVLDVIYKINLSALELQKGKVVQVQSSSNGDVELLKVKIPAESRSGQKLRLKGKGNLSHNQRGDLYLHLQQSA